MKGDANVKKILNELKDNLSKELSKYAEKRTMTASDLDVVHKLTSTIKNIEKIEMFIDGEYDDYDDGGSYAGRRRRGEHYVRGHYSMMDDDGYSERRRYSRDDGYSMNYAKEDLMRKLGGMMEIADEHQRDILKNAMRELEK